MAIGFDVGTSASSSAGVSSLTYNSASVGTLTDGVAIVCVGYYERARSVSSITYGGSAMTKKERYEDGVRQATVEMWYIVAPPSGVSSIVITLDASLGGGNRMESTMASFSRVNQSTPIETTTAKSIVTGTHTTHSQAITPAADGGMVIDVLLCGGSSVPSVTGSGQNASAALTDGAGVSMGSSYTGPVSPAASTTMAWSFGSSSSASNLLVAVLKENTAATTRGRPFGQRGNAFNGGRTFQGIIYA